LVRRGGTRPAEEEKRGNKVTTKLTSSTSSQAELDAAARPDWRENGYAIEPGPPEEPPPGMRMAVSQRPGRLGELITQEGQAANFSKMDRYNREITQVQAENYANWPELVKRSESIQIPRAAAAEILEMGDGAGARVTEYLLHHPEEARSFAEMTPHAVKRAIERIGEKVSGSMGALPLNEYDKARAKQIAEDKKRKRSR
jgi:hypothetical protein